MLSSALSTQLAWCAASLVRCAIACRKFLCVPNRRLGGTSSFGSILGRSLVAVGMTLEVDSAYPGTAVRPALRMSLVAGPATYSCVLDQQVARMRAARERAVSLSSAEMGGDWEAVRQRVLWAAGLRDIKDAPPGRGYTGHAFSDANHCDATTMLGEVSHSANDGSVGNGIAIGNQLGPGIEIASLPELGTGGSWSTCTNGCHLEPPQDVSGAGRTLRATPDTRPALMLSCGSRAGYLLSISSTSPLSPLSPPHLLHISSTSPLIRQVAHVQFRSRIAFKLVWVPPALSSFVLVDDAGSPAHQGMGGRGGCVGCGCRRG